MPRTLQTIAVLALAGACVDLPSGWEDAVPVAALTQSDCDGSPYDTGFDEDATATTDAGRITLVYDPVAFRCAQTVEGFFRVDGDRADVLVQPIDMHPGAVAACDCAYRVTVDVDAPDAATVGAWRRWDAINDPNPPVQVAEIALP
ncbi:MAG: hypothetical protein H6733_07095 [Alphaproteobacteria bacterium]|nr:hypothetical protein [Alphaproteobacteria bacterium]